MIDMGKTKRNGGSDAGSVTVMLGMLQSIWDEASDDEVMDEFADTIVLAIGQLRDLQRLAYETMIEAEAERALGRGTHVRLTAKRPH